MANRRMSNSMQHSNPSTSCWSLQRSTYSPVLFYFSSGMTRTIPKLPRFSYLPPPVRARVLECSEFARQGEAIPLFLSEPLEPTSKR